VKIAVIGAGISGMGAAYALSEDHDVTLFEKDARFGGHAQTVDAHFGDKTVPVDTGFIVYNYRNYPNLTGLFDHLDVPTKWSSMTFGMSIDDGRVEYAFDSLDKIFAQRRNILSPRFVSGMREVRRFLGHAQNELDAGRLGGLSLGEWLGYQGYSKWFHDCFILPMGGAIWSTPTDQMLDFPAENLVTFFRNHDLLVGFSPAQRWRTVDGGSRQYVDRLIAALGDRVRLGTEIKSIERSSGAPCLTFADGSQETFHQVIIATHGPDAARLLEDKDSQEAQLLGQFKTSQNRAVLHSDPRLMPKRRKVWSAWNFLSDSSGDAGRPAPVTYWMNHLQGIPHDTPLFVSLNPSTEPDPSLLHADLSYAHPLFESGSFAAQRDLDAVQGRGGIWYAGAWLGYGFHEDGLASALRVTHALGSLPAWAKTPNNPLATAHAQAAE